MIVSKNKNTLNYTNKFVLIIYNILYMPIIEQPDFVPYAGIQGYWLHPRYFKGKNTTFGYFKCVP